jgi:Ca2+-binding EF-hand superfamily protein
MRSIACLSGVILAALVSFTVTCAEEPEAIVEKKEMPVLPKVPVRSAILKDGENESATISNWVKAFMEGKEKKANIELEELKKNARAQEETRAAAEKERKRRQDKYDQNFGTVGASASSTRRAPLRMKLDFQVLEIDTFRAISETQRAMQGLANDIAKNLTSLDRDGDGKLKDDEYREAGAIVVATRRMFSSIDANSDGFISEEELDLARKLPPNMSAAIRAGKPGAAAANFKIKPFDKDGDGVLDVDERKALASAFVDLSVKLGQEADFYKAVSDNLAKAREIVAGKFAEVEVGP